MSSSFTVVQEFNGYKQNGNDRWIPPPFPGTRIAGPNSAVQDGQSSQQTSTTKQNNRRTNVTIPYTRCAGIPKNEPWKSQLRHGELAFTHARMQSAPSHPSNHNYSHNGAITNVYDIHHVNQHMRNSEPYALPQTNKNAPPFLPAYLLHNTPARTGLVEESEIGLWLPDQVRHWQPDGVVNVIDTLGGSDDATNVTIQGPASMINGDDRSRPKQICASRSDTPLSRLYVGLRATRANPNAVAPAPFTYTFKMELFSSGMIRRGEVHMEDFNVAPHYSKIVKVWQYGRLTDARHVESMDEQRCIANIFVHPPMIHRPAQKTHTPRMGNVYSSSHHSPPSGLLWIKTDVDALALLLPNSLPKGFTRYAPLNAATNAPVDIQARIQGLPRYGLGGVLRPDFIELTDVEWNTFAIAHEHNKPSLFYNMYIVINNAVYVPIPDDDSSRERKGAFPLPTILQHGRAKDLWAKTRDAHGPNITTPDGVVHPVPAAPPSAGGLSNDINNNGRRPGWDDADVQKQLFKKEMPHVHRVNHNDNIES
jgi:hypothetical protein